jgi:integrating conjugative element protein (TIGR03765 family)
MRRTPLVLCFAASLPIAALLVIRDAGGEPIAPRNAQAMQARVAPLVRPGLTYGLGEPLKHYLPIRSPSLTPGPAEARRLTTRFLQPLFLVGSDPESLRWLAANRERLTQLHAVGMLVQAETMAEVQAVTAVAQGLPLLPASGEAFAAELRIPHYPVLITREGIGP